MKRRRPPVFMCAVAASYIVYVAVTIYVWAVGPEAPGIQIAWMDDRLIIQKVFSGSPAAEAGIRPGDRALQVDGRPLRDYVDWSHVLGHLEVGRPLRLTVERAGEPVTSELTISQRPVSFWWSGSGVIGLSLRTGQLVYIALALLLVFAKPHDGVARTGALLLGAAAGVTPSPPGFAAEWREAPVVLHPFLWLFAVNESLGFGLLLTFFAMFPRPLPGFRTILIAGWAPLLAIQPWAIRFFLIERIYTRNAGLYPPDWLVAAIPVYWVVYPLAVIALASANYVLLQDKEQRRRVALIFGGTSVAVLANLPRIILSRGDLPSTALGAAILSPAAGSAAALLSLAMPASFAAAILRKELFGIRLMLRQGLRYALARGLILAVVPVLGVVLTADIVLHADQALVAIMAERGWIYISVAIVAMTVHVRRGRWLHALERHFLREQYDGQLLLATIVRDIRESSDFDQAASRVVSRIDSALHPLWVALLVRASADTAFEPVAVAPGKARVTVVPSHSRALALLTLLGKPLASRMGAAEWLQQMPPDEVEWLTGQGIELLVPVSLTTDNHQALLLLGPKRSEEHYNDADRELLEAIAASTALALPGTGPGGNLDASLRECPTCGRCYTVASIECSHDRAQLTARSIPRVLGGRYRLERRIASGGMGTVYEALDLTLERTVAAKLVREDLVHDSVTVARFEREARVAARFAHPNVVTVFDFGVAAASRAFLIMELLQGRTLREELRTNGKLDVTRTLVILKGVCEGVQAAHERNMIHRDLKPENIFLTQHGVKILDFGLSKLIAPVTPGGTTLTQYTAAGVLAGTPAYMAPEQLSGNQPAPAWDIWALCAISFEMLTSYRPFAKPNPRGLQFNTLLGHVVSLPAELHYDLAAFYQRAFSVDPRQRPATAMDVLTDLTNALSGQSAGESSRS